jgi:hypothetical protein
MLDRNLAICRSLISRTDLNLEGIHVLTECASGAYAYTPVLAAMAGATVIAAGGDSRYGSFLDNKQNIEGLLAHASARGKVEFIQKDRLTGHDLSSVDLVTNSGGLRPITADLLKSLSPRAVIALMWETWEFRKDDLDINYCQDNGLLVVGTNERNHILDMFGYNAIIVLKLLLEMGVEVHNNRIAILGSGKSAQTSMDGLKGLIEDVHWYGNETEGAKPYAQMQEILELEHLDAIVVYEHSFHGEVLGRAAELSFAELKEKFPALKVGVVAGNVDRDELTASGLQHFPERILPFGYMSYETINIGPRPVLELNTLGLKVGQLAVESRRQNEDLEQVMREVVDSGLGMDFPGGFQNFVP